MVLPGHKRSVTCIYTDHELFVSGGADGAVRVWDSKKHEGSDLNPYCRVRCIKVREHRTDMTNGEVKSEAISTIMSNEFSSVHAEIEG